MIHSLILSIKVALACAVLYLTFALALAAVLAFVKFKAKILLEFIITLPLIFPPMAMGFLLLLCFGQRSIVGQFLAKFGIEIVFSTSALIIASFLSGLPLFIKPVVAAFEGINPKIIQAATLLNASKSRIFISIIIPMAKKSIICALLIALARGLGEVGISLMLGGNIEGKTDTLSLALYNAVMDANMQKAFIICAILIAFSCSLYFILWWFSKDD